MRPFAVVDLFAGPGGLAEGFSSVRTPGGEGAFEIALSIEKERSAHSTLLLRAFLRQFDTYPDEYYDLLNGASAEPNWEALYPDQWAAAKREAWLFELGSEDSSIRLDGRIDQIAAASEGRTVLIGGPPCQAYSLVGRARNRGKQDYVASSDERHFLYREYIRILDRLRPVVFVMENVKGILSSSVDGRSRIIDRVLEDLRGNDRGGPRYRLVALAPRRSPGPQGNNEPAAADFIVRAEDHGIPQARHRVIVVGIREDLAARLEADVQFGLMPRKAPPGEVRHVLEGMPALRSGLSRRDSEEAWRAAALNAAAAVASVSSRFPSDQREAVERRVAELTAYFRSVNRVPDRSSSGVGIGPDCPAELREWLIDDRLANLPNHEARGHMADDLARYLFASIHAEVVGKSPKAANFPAELAPRHRNWASGKFADRFRVQTRNGPATTVTSHISKDGHYFIHPDPHQIRSLTVREAARLQTFPDNYLFKGNRTEQYIQVGNAVPPLLAKRIGQVVLGVLIVCDPPTEYDDLCADAAGWTGAQAA